ncbi:TonB-dependent receptor [Pseudomaricurvus alkylphenolicus]|uniref:TonB-dependent receptor n=1 Tax=Pseudomaricurvus alkylphenolicus TaxID=1306991 RepID=UPI001423CE39|nr:TonB-dependent receptor [Pseudomaricurvus alkylphenolicus]NIB38285.1 TonB-dependent receptor [Pseudomaricurvus alkylphenolicus]
MNKVKSMGTAKYFTYATLAAAISAANVSAAVLEEIVVTAQKREQSLQDVGISVSAFSGDQMKDLGVTNTVEITEQVPGLQLNTWSPTITIFNLRGVSQNNFTDNLEAPVAVYIDDSYVASMNMISGQLFDVERVEVLRGPQGTLFGRNATGGVIHFLTKGADEEELNGYIEATVADYDKMSIEGAVGGALSDNVRARVAARWEQSDGYIEAAAFPEGNPRASSGEDLGGSDGYAFRGALQIDLNDKATLELMYKYTEDEDVPTGGYSFLPYGDNTEAYIPPEFQDFVTNVISAPAEATGDIFFCPSQLDCFAPVNEAGLTIFEGDSPTPHKHFSDYEGFFNRETQNFTARLDWELDNGMELVSITNYADMDKFYTEDGDGIPVSIIEFTTIADFEQLSQEIRLSGSTDSTRWQVGAFWLDMETNADVITRGAPVSGVAAGLGFDPAALTNPSVVQDYTLESSNWSVFGQAEFDLNDSLTLIAGLRWSQDDKDMRFQTGFVSETDGINVPGLFDLQSAIAEAGGGDQDNVDYGDYAARLQLDWRLNDGTLVFASFNRGIKGGNFAPSANVGVSNIKHDEEVLNSYEIGIKTEMMDGLARLNATAFYYDYEDYQAFTFSDATPSVANADATNVGAEFELFLTPNEHWDIMLGLSYMDSEVDGVQTPQQQVTPVGFEVDWPVDILDGVELPNAPAYSLNYLFRYNWDMLGGNAAVQIDGTYYDDQYLEVTNGGGALQEAYGVTNANVSWTSEDDTWQLKAWVKNLGDEEYKLYNLDLGILGSTAFYAPPRWYGVTANYKF